jgi:hypothetical protein
VATFVSTRNAGGLPTGNVLGTESGLAVDGEGTSMAAG